MSNVESLFEKNKTNGKVKNYKPSWVGHPYHFSPWEPLFGMRSVLLQLFAAVLHKQQMALTPARMIELFG